MTLQPTPMYVAVCCRVSSKCCSVLTGRVSSSTLQSDAVCCSLLQSVAVCCSLLQSAAVCCSLLQRRSVFASHVSSKTLPAIWCSLLQSVQRLLRPWYCLNITLDVTLSTDSRRTHDTQRTHTQHDILVSCHHTRTVST